MFIFQSDLSDQIRIWFQTVSELLDFLRPKHFKLLIIYKKIIHVHMDWIHVFNRQCLSACYAHEP